MKKEEYAMALSVLHKYWIWSNLLRIKFTEQITKTEGVQNLQIFYLSEVGVYMMYWYSSLYVVIEGYKKFKMKNLDVDKLLNDCDKLELLKRFRNGAFHVQKEYFNEKYLDFIIAKNSAEWVARLSDAMGKYLLYEMTKLKSQ